MGMDCYAKVVLGIKVDISKLTVSKKVKKFDHDYSEEFEFDPKTGKKLWRDATFYNPDIFPDLEGEFDGYDLGIDNYNLVSINDTYFIAMDDLSSGSHRSGCEIGYYSMENFSKDFQTFKKCMEDRGLMNDSFGIYSGLYISV
ncbi:hypothetical protein UFOVP1290_376 [uncultured Caudovirales phage]|uniref:Uncharacterized protein n=1 Tax=uncultured Caudovirales phage TaxID=2100421 RepID=A0A6J5RRE8_9CAUD|nr:hypothetical protein UFOVP1290_376 [uncultured Caudovirales phage]